MNIFAISDLHLSFGTNKPMDIFGERWSEYEKKIENNWLEKVKDDDIVILSGDFSWATYLEEAKNDFKFLNNLPGKKILIKGNHDYWWETISKMEKFIKENDFQNIYFLHNNSYEIDDYVICGSRYWNYEENSDNEKIYNREIERIKISLNSAKESIDAGKKVILVTHYPPDERIIDIVKGYNVKKWIYGHIHSNYEDSIVNIEGIDTYLTSCDYLDFDLIKIK